MTSKSAHKSPGIILAKLTPPELPPYYIPRPQLYEKFLRYLQWKIILVAAPVGYGKTALLSEWYHRLQNESSDIYNLAWFSLSEDDQHPLRFLKYFTVLAQRIWPDLRWENDFPQSENDAEDYFIEFSNYLHLNQDKTNKNTVIFLDNIDEVPAKAVLRLLSLLADYLPANVHVVVGGSMFPSSFVDFNRWDAVCEFPPHELEFTKEESLEFIAKILDKEEVDRSFAVELYELTQGWAAGIRTYAEAVVSGAAIDSGYLDQEAVNPFVDRFFDSCIFKKTSPEIVEFLIETSILDCFSAEMCNYVTQRTDSATIINRLVKQNFFIEACDNEHKWYRYHPLFSKWLRSRFLRLKSDKVRELCFHASEWYEKHHLENEAAKCMLMSCDWDLVEALAASGGFERKDQSVGFLTWTIRIPAEEFPQDSTLSLLATWGYYCAARAPEALSWLAIFEKNRKAENSNEGIKQGQKQTSSTDVMIDFVKIKCKNFDGHYDEAIAGLTGILSSSNQLTPSLRCIIVHALAESYERVGGHAQALEYYLQSEALAELAHSAFFVAFSRYSSCWVYVHQGKMEKAEMICKKALRDCPSDYTLYGALYDLLAYIQIECNQIDLAEDSMKKALRRVSSNRNADMLLEANSVKACLLAAKGEEDEAYRLIVQNVTVAENQGVPRGVLFFAFTTQARIALLRDNIPDAALTNEKLVARIGENDTLYQIKSELIAARIEASVTETASALMRVGSCIERARAADLESLVLEALILEVVLLSESDQKTRALAQLNEALLLSYQQKVIDPYLREGEPMRVLLHEVVNIRKTNNTIRTSAKIVLQAFSGAYASGYESRPVEPTESSFTKREEDVLALLNAGMSRQEIAETLCVSQNTVKTHIKNIYQKLGVNSRVGAFKATASEERL